MKKFSEIMVLVAVLFFTAFIGHRQGAEERGEKAGHSVERVVISGQKQGTKKGETEQTAEREGTERTESSFVFRIDTLYARVNTADADWMDNGEDMTGGHIQEGKIKPGDKAVLVKSDGTCYMTVVEKISRNGETDYFLEEAGGSSLLYIWLKGVDYDRLEYGDLLLGQTEWVRGVSVDFPFEESEEYSLTFALPEAGEKQGEFRLYDQAGEVLQRISCDSFTEQTYYVVYRDNRRNLVFFPDKESDAGRFLEWEGGRFSERETDIKRGILLYGDLLLTQESETELTMEIYRHHPYERISEEIRRFTLQKSTGELEIWDCLDRKDVFRGIVSIGDDGTPVNEEYYQVLFTEGLYAWLSGGKDGTIPVNLRLNSTDEYSAEYESREAFLSDYGFADSNPLYEFYDRMDNLRLELYGNESEDLFCGILYRYFYDGKKEKCFRMTGFVSDDIEDAEWVDNMYAPIDSLNDSDYEKSMEYTADNRPSYFLAKGDDGTGEKEGENVPLVEINYIYRDDGTLYDRHYRHNSYWAGSTRSSMDSLYDEKERLVYQQAYITHGTLEEYYIYPNDSNKPAYCLEFDYAGGAAPWTSIVRYD